ncbi:RDD family protein [Nanoarchaeota archaeon]
MNHLILASVWKRAGAVIIDALAIFLISYVFVITNFFLNPLLFQAYHWVALSTTLLYFFILEANLGQTFGKMLFRIKVLNEGGIEIGWRESIIRNLVRFIDVLPFFYLVGFISILVSRKKQRLGDLAAKTVVVSLK